MIFDEQIARKPDLYPWTKDFIKSMHNGFWTSDEFNFTSDIQDFKVKLSLEEKEIISRTLSAISQIEVSVKTFWAKLGDSLPHPSIRDLGYVMANVEVIHNNAYEKLLDILGLEDMFESNLKLDFMQGRVKYLRKYLNKQYKDNKKQFVYALILFTLFVENVSLFSQFYVINWFGRKNLLKDTNQQTSYTLKEECYIEDTEVLTPTGWKFLKDMKIGDDVVQYNKNNSFSFTKVLHTTNNHYIGDMISFSRKGCQCIVTPNHDMIYFNKNNELIKRKAVDVKFHKGVFIPKGAPLSNRGINNISFEDRLRIAIQADGTNAFWKNSNGEKILKGKNGGYTHYISLTKERKQKRMDWILSNLNLEYAKCNIKNGKEIKYSIRYNHDFDYKNFDWVNLLDKTQNWSNEFIEEVVEWDGFRMEEGRSGYSSTNKSCIDKIQTMAIFAGYYTSFYPCFKKGYKNPCYKLSFNNKDNNMPVSHGINKEILKYDGNVYCITVESGMIITRYKNKTFISGNCVHALAGVKLINVIKQEHPEFFDDDLKNKVTSEAKEAFKAESKIIDWMVNGVNYDNLSAEILKEFVKNRINDSMKMIGFDGIFDVDSSILRKTKWFDEDIYGNSKTDFFFARPTEYQKKSKDFSAEELF